MKRTVKMLIAAGCATSMVGVGAVSFAKWNPATATEASGSINTGYVALTGFETDTLDLGEKTLVPYDQGSVAADQTDIITVALPIYQVSSDYTLSVKIEGTLAEGSSYYVKLDKNTAAAAPASLEGWTKVGGSYAELNVTDFAYSNAEGSAVLQTIEDANLHIILVSESGNDMKQTATISLKLAEAEVTDPVA